MAFSESSSEQVLAVLKPSQVLGPQGPSLKTLLSSAVFVKRPPQDLIQIHKIHIFFNLPNLFLLGTAAALKISVQHKISIVLLSLLAFWKNKMSMLRRAL